MDKLMEPLIHSHITDELPNGHKLAQETVYCKSCDKMLHHSINECMQTWVETGYGNYCIKCFSVHSVLDDIFSL